MANRSTLILETSTPQGSIALAKSGEIFQQSHFSSDRRHNAALFDPLQELLGSIQVSEIERVIVGSGPGSYSGTRVGIAAAQGVAIAANCPAIAVPSILAVPEVESGASCLAIGDARRGSFWVARIRDCQLESEPELMERQQFQSIVSSCLNKNQLVFSFEDSARFPIDSELIQEIKHSFPTSDGLWRAWQSAKLSTQEAWLKLPPQPLYLKPPHITPAKRSLLNPG